MIPARAKSYRERFQTLLTEEEAMFCTNFGVLLNQLQWMNFARVGTDHCNTARSNFVWVKERLKLDTNLRSYIISVSCLNIACKISNHGFIDKCKNLLKILCDASDMDISLPKARNTSEIVELLQKLAVEHTTISHQLEARNFCSVATIVATDFAACTRTNAATVSIVYILSTQSVRTLL